MRRNKNYGLIQEAVGLWEEARRHDVTPEKRSKLVAAILAKCTGHIAELAGSHAASRVIQTCAKYGTPAGGRQGRVGGRAGRELVRPEAPSRLPPCSQCTWHLVLDAKLAYRSFPAVCPSCPCRTGPHPEGNRAQTAGAVQEQLRALCGQQAGVAGAQGGAATWVLPPLLAGRPAGWPVWCLLPPAPRRRRCCSSSAAILSWLLFFGLHACTIASRDVKPGRDPLPCPPWSWPC